MNKGFAIFLLVVIGSALFGWREYERQYKNMIKQKHVQEKVKRERRRTEEALEIKEKNKVDEIKFKVQVEHDSKPETDTYSMILDATNSFDPDLGDKLFYSWKQISGSKIEFKPNPSSGIVSFDGPPGEYSIELIVTDNYGESTKMIKNIVIESEPNEAPIIDLEIRKSIDYN